MVTVVVVINLALALLLLYVASRVWRLRLRLARVASNLSMYERTINILLRGAPNTISTGQWAIRQLREGNQPLDLELVRIQQVLTLLGVGRQVWQRSRLVQGSKFLKKALPRSKYR